MTRTPWAKEYGRWINRLRWKSAWKWYQADAMTYSNFRLRTFEVVNAVRVAVGNKPYDEFKFDNGWQYRVVGHENYKIAYEELLQLIFGWW